MKSLLIVASLGIVCALLSAPGPAEEKTAVTNTQAQGKARRKPIEPRIRRFMRAKLGASQNVLEGLVTEDYAQIRKGAKSMLVMSKAADFQVFPTATYSQYSGEFQRAVARLDQMAAKKQLDSAALSYMHITMTCVNCHKYVVKEKVALGEPVPAGLKLALHKDAAGKK